MRTNVTVLLIVKAVNGWMYAMIAVGSAFIIFVIASIYLMW